MTSTFWSRFAEQRISRRRALMAAGAVGAAAFIVPSAACDDGDGDPEAEEPRAGGTLRYGTTVPVAYGLDPHLEQGSGLPAIARAYGYLFHVDPRDDALILDHATSAEQPEPGVYLIRVGQRTFHTSPTANGRAVTADDAIMSMRRYRDHPLVTSKFWHTQLLDGHGASDASTIVVRTTRPYVYSLQEMGHINAGAIVPSESATTSADLRAGVSGSGPMMIGLSSSGLTRLERFDGYDPAAHVDAMEWRVFAAEEDKRAAFRDRNIDVLVARDRREALGFAANDVEVITEPSLSWTSIGFRVDRPPFDDPRVRRAIDLAIDREAIIGDAASGEGEIAGPVNPHLAGGYWALPREELAAAQSATLSDDARLAEARMLLEAAAVRDAVIEMQVASVPELLDLAALVREQILPLGVDFKAVPLPLPGWFFSYRAGNFHATLISHAPYETPDASLRLYHSRGAEGAGNSFAFSDPAIDWLVERSWAEDDREQRQSTVREVQRLMIEARPMVHLFSGSAYTVARDYVRDSGLDLPGSLARYWHRQWLDADQEEPA